VVGASEVEESLVEVPKILGDVFEAVVCAMYLDSGMDLELVWKIVRPMFMPFIGKTAVATQFFILSFTSVAQSSEQAPFTSENVGSSLTMDSCEKSQSTLCRKSWVFSGCSGFLPQRKLTGWVRINTVKKVISQLLKKIK
jgi:hypothetical protein